MVWERISYYCEWRMEREWFEKGEIIIEHGEWRKDDLRKDKLFLRMEKGERMTWKRKKPKLMCVCVV